MNLLSLDIENNMLPQHNQKSFWLYQFSIFLTPKNCILETNFYIFLYISVRKLLLQGRKKILDGGGIEGVGSGFLGRLSTFLKVTRYLGLLKCFPIFDFNIKFWNSNFSTSILPSVALKQFGLQG